VRSWAARYPDEISAPSPTVQTEAQMTADLDARIRALHEVADRLYARWLAAPG
jgi:hypothetical protein